MFGMILLSPAKPLRRNCKATSASVLRHKPTKVRADIEVTCFGYDGIDAIKEALRCAEAKNTKETQVKVKLVQSAALRPDKPMSGQDAWNCHSGGSDQGYREEYCKK